MLLWWGNLWAHDLRGGVLVSNHPRIALGSSEETKLQSLANGLLSDHGLAMLVRHQIASPISRLTRLASSIASSRLKIVVASAAATAAIASGCSSAPKAAPVVPLAPVTQAAPVDGKAPLMWKVEGKTGPSYLLGTVHLGVSASELSPLVHNALGETTTFISEVDLDQARANPFELMEFATLPNTQRLDALIGEANFEKLAALVEVPRQSLLRVKPWFAYTNVFGRLYPGESMDAALRETAINRGQTPVYLEDWRDQISILSRVVDANDLKLILDPGSSDRQLLTEMVAAYQRGDFAQLSALLAGPAVIADDPEQFKLLFADRNRNWMPTLIEHLSRGRTFVAVGVGHFAGGEGLLRLLAEAGVEATRVGLEPVLSQAGGSRFEPETVRKAPTNAAARAL